MTATHRRLVPISEHAVLIGAGQDPRSRADHECNTPSGCVAFCPACEPAIYAAMASRHARPRDYRQIMAPAAVETPAASRTETVLSWT